MEWVTGLWDYFNLSGDWPGSVTLQTTVQNRKRPALIRIQLYIHMIWKELCTPHLNMLLRYLKYRSDRARPPLSATLPPPSTPASGPTTAGTTSTTSRRRSSTRASTFPSPSSSPSPSWPSATSWWTSPTWPWCRRRRCWSRRRWRSPLATGFLVSRLNLHLS